MGRGLGCAPHNKVTDMAITYTAQLTGYTRQCGRQSGGVSRIGIAQVTDIDKITVQDGMISAITMKSGSFFKDYQSALDQAEYKFADTEASILIRLNRVGKESSNAYNALKNLAPCGLVAIAQLNNGETVLLGYTEEFGFTRPIVDVTSDSSSGKALTDENYFDVTLKTSQVLAPLFLSDSVSIDTLFKTA